MEMEEKEVMVMAMMVELTGGFLENHGEQSAEKGLSAAAWRCTWQRLHMVCTWLVVPLLHFRLFHSFDPLLVVGFSMEESSLMFSLIISLYSIAMALSSFSISVSTLPRFPAF